MGSKYSPDKALVCACCSSTTCGSMSDKLLSWRSSLVRKFRALLGCPQSSDLSQLGHCDTAPARSMDSNVIQDSPLVQEDTKPTHPLDSNSIQSRTSSVKSRPSSLRLYKHDVFLSFRGIDTRNNFIDHLYNNLIRKGIFAFKDDEKLEKGEPISSQLLQAIKDSRVSIIVFSSDYASSTWCLEEMAAIAECKKELGQTVFSIFYDVDPADVRKQTGVYENAFVLHTKTFEQDVGKVDRWKRAMTDLANSVGWDVRDNPEFTEIDKIIQKVIKILDHKFSELADDLIGIQSRVKELENLLKLSSKDDDFRVLGIWGMGGIGKTTLATVLYDKIAYKFDACCFIEDVSKIYRDGGATAIQRQILRQTFDEQNLDACGPSEISGRVINRLSPINVLIVLDNVDEPEQLEELAISPKLLGKGSRMIITTRNEHILKIHKVDAIHKASLLNYDDARELFLRKVFKNDVPSNNRCVELIPDVLEYVQSLPLAIKVMGSFLCNRDAFQWRDALERLRKSPEKKIIDVLQISFEGLQQEEKEIFLHIACFFRGEREEYVKRILDSCGLNPHIGIQVIMEKSLITIRNQEIHMHEMLQKLGKKIVQEKYPQEPTSWSRLWLYKDFENVLMSAETGTNHVKAIVLDEKEDGPKCSQLRIEGLSKMRGLKLLILYHKNFSGSLNFLSHNLQYLLWHGYPFSSLPSFQPYSSLVELNMPYSSVKRLWEGRKNIPFLERVDLSHSKHLIETPNFEWSPNLKRLDLTGCTSLTDVHPSIGLLTQLAYLSLRDCKSLNTLDLGTECKLSSLRVLHLSGCTHLRVTPNFTGLSNLEYLDLEQCTSLYMVDGSIGALASLKFLSLIGCRILYEIPNDINNMTSLQTLYLRSCLELRNLPLGPKVTSSSGLESLIFLDLGFCSLEEIPDSIGELRCLERLNLERNDFSSIPDTIKRLSRLAYLNLAHCKRLEKLPELPFDSASSGGRYFQTVSTSRNHRSGLYIFNCNMLKKSYWMPFALSWLARLLVEQPCHFRCGFDIGIPVNGGAIPEWYFDHQFKGGSKIRIVDSDVNDDWLGFAFCAIFELNTVDPLFSSRPHSLYLSLESEHTEEYFNGSSCLDININGTHGWIIYISKSHCHFVNTQAHIGFKADPAFKVHKWGLRMVFKQDIEVLKNHLDCLRIHKYCPHFHSRRLVIENVHERSNSSEPKIRLPYNWLVTEEEENENVETKNKEDNLSNAGLRDT